MGGVREAVAFCLRREHLRRTIKIALTVGTILTLINQGDVLFSGDAGTVTAIKIVANYCIPFTVANLGLLSGRPAAS